MQEHLLNCLINVDFAELYHETISCVPDMNAMLV